MEAKKKAAKMVKAIKGDVDTLLMATAFAELERERVNKIQREVLASEVFLMDEKHLDRGREDARILDPEKAWLMNDVDAPRYYAKLSEIHLDNGFEDAAKGYCPALVAENLQLEAEWALIKAAEKFFPGIDNNRLLNGIHREDGSWECGLDVRKKYLDLLIGMVVNYPGYKQPLARMGKAVGV